MSVVTIMLTHQAPEAVRRMVAHWHREQPDFDPLVAYGGPRELFEALADDPFTSVFIDDPRLHTADHPRERQSYLGVFKAVAAQLAGSPAQFLHLVEYDEVPVVRDVHAALIERLRAEGADLLASGLKRVDGTGDPHYLNHCHDPAFASYWERISCREDKGVVLSALGCGTFWQRAAFEAVAALEEETPIYLELFLPTAAHHLGYRVRPLRGQYRFMHPDNRFEPDDLRDLAGQGALCAHPVKTMWLDTAPRSQ